MSRAKFHEARSLNEVDNHRGNVYHWTIWVIRWISDSLNFKLRFVDETCKGAERPTRSINK